MNKYRKYFKFFKVNKKVIYLDSAATGLKLTSSVKAESKFLLENGSNIGRGMYDLALKATNMYEGARNCIARFLNCVPEEIVFTTGTTEGLNIISYIVSHNITKNDNVIISRLEHNSSLIPWLRLSKEVGFQLKFIPFNKDGLIIDELVNLVDNNTKAVIISLASNVLGTTPDLVKINNILQDKNVLLICDGAQYMPHNKLDLSTSRIDFLAFSGHKMYAPNGIGVLYIKNNPSLKMLPYKVGGGMIDGYLDKDIPRYLKPPHLYEAGTPLIGQAIGLKEAINVLDKISLDTIKNIECELLEYAMKKLSNISDIEIVNHKAQSPIISFVVNNIHSHDITTYLANKNISIRAGFHCAEELLKELGYNMGCLRVSFAFYNTKKEIDRFIQILLEAIKYFKG